MSCVCDRLITFWAESCRKVVFQRPKGPTSLYPKVVSFVITSYLLTTKKIITMSNRSSWMIHLTSKRQDTLRLELQRILSWTHSSGFPLTVSLWNSLIQMIGNILHWNHSYSSVDPYKRRKLRQSQISLIEECLDESTVSITARWEGHNQNRY